MSDRPPDDSTLAEALQEMGREFMFGRDSPMEALMEAHAEVNNLRRRLGEVEAREEELKNRLASAHIIQDQGRDRAVADLKARVTDLEAENKRLGALVLAQDNLIAWYETENDRSEYADDGLPAELVELERAVHIADDAEAAKEH